MNLTKLIGWSSALCLTAVLVQGQTTNDLEKLTRQLKQLQDTFEQQQRELRQNFERIVRDQQAQIDALRQQLESSRTNAAPTPAQSAPAVTNEPRAATATAAPAAAGASPWSPAQPIRLGGAQNYINLSFDALVAAGASTARDIDGGTQLGGHDPKQRGFTVQNLETVFDGKVDPYIRGQANVVLQIDPHGDTTIEAEEAYLETMSLPWNLQAKAGQFFTEFGRLNTSHPHTWDFVDQPLVNGRFLGEDGLRSAGARLSWLAPTPFYSELFLTLANSQGGTAYSFRNDHGGGTFLGRLSADRGVKGPGDMLFAPRYAASFDLTAAQTIVAGASAAFGPNSTGGDTDTQIYGMDLFWKWKSPYQHGGFPFVAWQTEAMMRRFAAGAFNWDRNGNGITDSGEMADIATGLPASLPRETVTDFGLYSQIVYGFHKGWVAGLRGDYVFPETRAAYESILGFDRDRASRWRVSPNLTYYPSEFAKIRLQYNYDHRNLIGDDHSVWLEFEFLLGAHAAHKF